MKSLMFRCKDCYGVFRSGIVLPDERVAETASPRGVAATRLGLPLLTVRRACPDCGTHATYRTREAAGLA